MLFAELWIYSAKKASFLQNLFVHARDPVYFSLASISLHRWLMASRSRDHFESEEQQLPQILPEKGLGQKKMRGSANPSKPPKAPKKKAAEPDDVPPAESEPDKEVDTDAQGLLSDRKPRKGGHGQEPNITAEMFQNRTGHHWS